MKIPRFSFLVPLAFLASTVFAISGCDQGDGPLEELGEEIDDAVDDAGDAIEDAGDELEDEL